jgi:hypothetical protein
VVERDGRSHHPCPGLEMKDTLLETTAGGPGGGLTPPYYQPGVVSKLFDPLGVSDLFRRLADRRLASQVRERGHRDLRRRRGGRGGH